MDTNSKDEMIEELEEIVDESTVDESNKTNEENDKTAVIEDIVEEPLNRQESNDDSNKISDDKEKQYEMVDQSLNQKKKSKAPIIVLLSIFLIIDIAALVIYIIGVDKVIEFIK